MAQVNVTIIGMNRIGGSFGLALKRLSKSPNAPHQFTITGSDENRDYMAAAKSMGAIDLDVRDPLAAIEKANIVVIASPYGLVHDLLEALGPEMQAGTVVIDLSSVKQPSIAWAKEFFRKGSDGKPEIYLVGVTPLINSDYLTDARDLIEAARADMFDRGTFIISPSASCPEEAVQLVVEMASLLGVSVHFTDPLEHDGIGGAMEGLPVLLQFALFRSISTSPAWDDLRRLGNLDFSLGTYRLGTDSPEDFGALIGNNREAVLRAIDSLMAQLTEFSALIRDGNSESIGAAVSDTMDKYRQWQVARIRNKWADDKDQEKFDAIPSGGFLGPLGGIFNFGKKSQGDSKK
jgi:prephenate dehydrogenase